MVKSTLVNKVDEELVKVVTKLHGDFLLDTRIQFSFDERAFNSTSRILLCCTHWGRDWLSMRPAVAGATFMNEFAPYAPPLKRRNRQRFTEFDYKG